jgi:CheY-like chemotaxis protein
MTAKSPLRILMLEDNSTDAELVRELLEADNFVCEVTRVETRAEFLAALENDRIDMILADYTLPSFDGISALKLGRSARPELPFIFVSGTLGEEVAIEALKTDYRGSCLQCSARWPKPESEPNARRPRRRCAGARCIWRRRSD